MISERFQPVVLAQANYMKPITLYKTYYIRYIM